ncbi:MAG: hypothetical protein COV43_04460 [Deltaproteobacteria bacterium CG11_big_fil_rev_8_21_14_0_20_42_23]|nr:MAG: hypothetical protein COV43_04460 [Deltaproteobacteria bacterium CG11_big_fil_rev_8_21_14_0_20_42_23]PJC65027.1 MAG: hypothetical protein CO021_00850 [Deltaproteobacteria bacterium CG_4_9_14_0_2_um_filter_42_21]
MVWTDQLRPASFRGIQFLIDSHDFSGGRRTTTHQFPERDEPYTEDMGREAREYSIQCHILGDNYFQTRDALIRACEKRGEGILVHPYLGNLNVVCTGFSLKEDTREGRIATFNISFVEAGKFQFPSTILNNSQNIIDKAEAVLDLSKRVFSDSYNLVLAPGYMVSSASSTIVSSLDLIRGSFKAIHSPLDFASTVQQNLTNIERNVDSLVTQNGSLSDSLSTEIQNVADTTDRKKSALDFYLSLDSFGDDFAEIPTLTPNRVREAQNREALRSLIRQTAVAMAAKSFIREAKQVSEGNVNLLRDGFKSLNEAEEARQNIVAILEREMNSVVDDDYFVALSDLKALLRAVMPNPGTSLASIAEFTTDITTPSLILVYDIYESRDLEQDIIDRNKVRNPAFIPGRSSLEVLAHG